MVAHRRTRDRDSVRLALIDAAREVLAREGYDGLTIRRVAERAEYSLGTVYGYFADKDDLLYSLVHEDFTRLTERLRAIRETHEGAAAVREMLLSYAQMGLEQPESYQVMFMFRPKLARRNASDESGEHAYSIFRSCVIAAMERGEFRRMNPDVVAQILWAAIHGLVSLRLTLTEFSWEDVDHLAETLVDAEIRGLAPDRGI
ncbi:MAG: TetR/AcrR family transcriptional regulator [Dehalococcoidia bacterium]